MVRGRSIRVFLADGAPGGIVTAEIVNWTGHVMTAPRSRLPDLLKRVECERTGVYVLIGDDPDGGLGPRAYIGESDNVGKRLAQHNRGEANGGKDFWDRACVVTSKDMNLTKAHVRYLEARLIAIAGESGRAKLENGTAPDFGLLPEADIADMEFFIEQMRIILPVLGIDLLREQPRAAPSIALEASATTEQSGSGQVNVIFDLSIPRTMLSATAQEIGGEFVVLEGSSARADAPDSHNSYRKLRDTLKDTGVLKADGEKFTFTRDFPFRKPSAASSVILDRNDNGRLSWRVKGTEKTYAQWQEEQVAAAEPSKGVA